MQRMLRGTIQETKSHVRAAQYVRMSTEHQRYSIENQMAANRRFALEHNIEIVRTYADRGQSGLSLKGRKGLIGLLSDVQGGRADFDAVLVYDVSRWGRFQDADEAAYYEFACKLTGVRVVYCAEQFQNDATMHSSLMKVIKRVMAGEYSRDLSLRVSRAHRQQAALCFHQGGPANFGLRRAIVGFDGLQKGIIERGQGKALHTDKVVLVKGPADEVAVVQEIFRLFVKERMSYLEIAEHLNGRDQRTGRGKAWTLDNVILILRSEKYIGNFVFGQTRWYLRDVPEAVRREDWVCVENAIEPIIDRETFLAAQLLMKDGPHFSDNELLDYLSAAWCALGLLSAPRLNASRFSPSHHTYNERFGKLTAAYARIGYKQINSYRYTHAPDHIRILHRTLVSDLVCTGYMFGSPLLFDFKQQVLHVGNDCRVSVVVLQHLPERGRLRSGCALHLNHLEPCDAILIARMDVENRNILDLHLVPRALFTRPRFRFTARSMRRFRRFRLASSSAIVRAVRRLRRAPIGNSSSVTSPWSDGRKYLSGQHLREIHRHTAQLRQNHLPPAGTS